MSMKKEEIINLPSSVISDLSEFLLDTDTYQDLISELEDYDIVLESAGYQVPIESVDELIQLKEIIHSIVKTYQLV